MLFRSSSSASKLSVANALRNNSNVISIYNDKTFLKFIQAIVYAKPTYFLYENVGSMNKLNVKAISDILGVEPVLINSVNFSAQNRRRLYWTNIPVTPPTQRWVSDKLKDILEDQVPNKYYISQKCFDYVSKTRDGLWKNNKTHFNPEYARAVTSSCHKHHRADTDTYVQTEHAVKDKTNVRQLTPRECEILQTLPAGYTDILKSDFKR